MEKIKYNIPDLDVDMSQKTRDTIIKKLYHIPASKINDKGINPHGVGVYFCNIPYDRLTGLASLDYKHAEEDLGYIKIDFLHNSIYDSFDDRQQLFNVMEQEPNWNLLYKKDVVEQLPHINNYFTLLNQLPKIDSVDKLAMFIAIIRPAKKYLISEVINNGWDSIIDKIWIKEDTGYMYKKSHAVAYALSITVAMSKFI
nr:MAG TPA: PROTEIN/DNA Complex, alpha subunit, TauC subunit [Caudoviricetes sp.]